MCLIDSSDPPHLPFPQNHAKREPMVLCELCKKFPMMERAKKATDVGLEPTASALGGLRATIAPTGQLLVVEEIDVFVQYIPQKNSVQKTPRSNQSYPYGHCPFQNQSAKFGSRHLDLP